MQVPRIGNRPAEKGGPFYDNTPGVEAYCFKFPRADAAVVRSTQQALANRGESYQTLRHKASGLCPHYSAYFTAR
eukprot:g12796.t1